MATAVVVAVMVAVAVVVTVVRGCEGPLSHVL